MTENIQKGFVYELIEIAKLLAIFAVKRLNLQHVLYLIAFLIFGIGDAVTAAYMMDARGPGIEANPIASYSFMAQGFMGVIAVKIWMTLAMLFVVYIIQLRSDERVYWTINGFLIALSIGGVMAMNANLTAMAGGSVSAPSDIAFIYIVLALVLIEIGSLVDKFGPKWSRF